MGSNGGAGAVRKALFVEVGELAHSIGLAAGSAAGEERGLDREEEARAFERFVRELGGRAFQFAYRLTGNVDEAKDLVQEAFFRMLRSWDRYDASRPMEAWFFRILRNIFLDVRKRYENRNKVSLDAPAESVAEEAPAYGEIIPFPETAVIEVLERREAAGLVWEVLGAMSCEYRAVLTLCDMQAMSYSEISQVLGIPEGTVRSRLSRARKEFRRRMTERMEVTA